MKIRYLNPEGAADIMGPLSKVTELVNKHALTVEYEIKDFVIAFNRGEISHLGYVNLVDEEVAA